MPGDMFSADYVRALARQARIAIDDADLPALRRDLSAVVAYVERLRAATLPDATDDPGQRLALADDAPTPADRRLTSEQLAAMAPRAEGPFVAVPKVLGDQGGGA